MLHAAVWSVGGVTGVLVGPPQEQLVREERLEHFCSKRFVVESAGPLFPPSWTSSICVSRWRPPCNLDEDPCDLEVDPEAPIVWGPWVTSACLAPAAVRRGLWEDEVALGPLPYLNIRALCPTCTPLGSCGRPWIDTALVGAKWIRRAAWPHTPSRRAQGKGLGARLRARRHARAATPLSAASGTSKSAPRCSDGRVARGYGHSAAARP